MCIGHNICCLQHDIMQVEYLEYCDNVLSKNVTFTDCDKYNMFASQQRNPLTDKNSNKLSEKENINEAH